MGMKDFNCDLLALSFRFTPEEIDRDALLEAAEVEDKDKERLNNEGGIGIARICGRREKTSDYHAHILMTFGKDGKGRVELRYHSDPLDMENEKPPHAEDCAQWLGGYFKTEEQDARITASFIFDKAFAPTIALPFPLATTEKALAGCSVTGVAVQFPPQGPLEMGIVQIAEDETLVSAYTAHKIRLRNFDLTAELEKLSRAVSSLVKKQESSEEKASAQE